MLIKLVIFSIKFKASEGRKRPPGTREQPDFRVFPHSLHANSTLKIPVCSHLVHDLLSPYHFIYQYISLTALKSLLQPNPVSNQMGGITMAGERGFGMTVITYLKILFQ
jgi:hypothetical protein